MINEAHIRADFPILARTVHGRPLVYLDSAATSQKPNAVIDAVANYYRTCNANIHRGAHTLGDEATEAYDQARTRLARFINARPNDVVFVRNTTEAINLVARSWGGANLQPGDEVVVTAYEHHSNLLPWQAICHERGAHLRILPMDDDQMIRRESVELIGPRTKMVAVVQVSNAFGSITPVTEIVAAARSVGALVLLDGAQSVPHLPVDVQAIGADFLAFSGHKMCGPMGIGVLWGREELLNAMPPFLRGGGIVDLVTFEETEFLRGPERFEAGTPNVADAIGLAAAVEYLDSIGMAAIREHERSLVAYGLGLLQSIPGVRIFGPRDADRQSGVISFELDGVHSHDVGTILDQSGIAIRVGKHCCHPAMAEIGISGTARASVYLYNTRAELDQLAEAVESCRKIMRVGV